MQLVTRRITARGAQRFLLVEPAVWKGGDKLWREQNYKEVVQLRNPKYIFKEKSRHTLNLQRRLV